MFNFSTTEQALTLKCYLYITYLSNSLKETELSLISVFSVDACNVVLLLITKYFSIIALLLFP